MTTENMSADKSRLLAYLKHTPGFEKDIGILADLTTAGIMARVEKQDERAHRVCVSRFRQKGMDLGGAPLRPNTDQTSRPTGSYDVPDGHRHLKERYV